MVLCGDWKGKGREGEFRRRMRLVEEGVNLRTYANFCIGATIGVLDMS